jgi:hypothetical protein
MIALKKDRLGPLCPQLKHQVYYLARAWASVNVVTNKNKEIISTGAVIAN